jgi:hypothetical protein
LHVGALKQFAAREGHTNVPARHVEQFAGHQIRLGQWVSARRHLYRRGQLPEAYAADLEAVPGWVWEPARVYRAHRKLAGRDRNIRKSAESGVPYSHIASEYRITRERVRQIVEGKRTSGPVRERWERHVEALAQFAQREGHTNVPAAHVEIVDGAPVELGRFVASRREAARVGTLAPGYRADLEAVPGWVWEPDG